MTPKEFRRQRDAAGWTQAVAAERLGVTRVAVARYETGTRKIPVPVARLLLLLVAEEQTKQRRKGGK